MDQGLIGGSIANNTERNGKGSTDQGVTEREGSGTIQTGKAEAIRVTG